MKTIRFPFRLAPHTLLTMLFLAFVGCRPSSAPADKNSSLPAETAEWRGDKPKVEGKVLVFRNVRSWNRQIDFEEVLAELGVPFEVKEAEVMEETDLAPYTLIIIPGAQGGTGFYDDYNQNAARFNDYTAKGGTLVLELNGAEDSNLALPLEVQMISHGAVDNEILLPKHPIVISRRGKPIHANFASHGYLRNIPNTALVLATESSAGQADEDKPTFVEYASGKGRVIAACQCFHDRDQSGRGPLMKTLLTYGLERHWYTPE